MHTLPQVYSSYRCMPASIPILAYAHDHGCVLGVAMVPASWDLELDHSRYVLYDRKRKQFITPDDRQPTQS